VRGLVAIVLLTLLVHVSSTAADTTSTDFTEMSLDDLLRVDVLSASKKAEPLSDTTSAIYVITAEDIRRSGHTTLAELMRLVPGMDVARVTSNTWAVSARGFNSQFANKLLVLLDGRSLYTPLFAGVYWNDQDIALDDIERIEVIRGPGGTIWGANAVNGVINIITRSAADTQGGHYRAVAGTEDRLITSFRHGVAVGDELALRFHGKYANHDESIYKSHRQAHDEWRNARSGVRMDWQRGERDAFTLDAEYHREDSRLPLQIDDALSLALGIGTRQQLYDTIDGRGGHLRLGWKRALGDASSLELAGYYDKRSATAQSHFSDRRAAYDLSALYRAPIGERHDVVWGAGYRLNRDRTGNTPNLRLVSDEAQDVVYSAFVQDDIDVVAEKLKLTFGSKVEWNDYTGWEVQPSVRAFFSFGPGHAVWAAVSRAVRTPNRSLVDVEELLIQTVPAGFLGCPGSILLLDPACHAAITGNQDYESEIVVAYELGWRVQPAPDVSLDLATFFNDYENLQSFRPTAADPLTQQAVNGSEAFTYGLEASARWFVADWWRIAFTYTGLQIQENAIRRGAGIEGLAPHHQLRLSSSMNLLRSVELDLHTYYVGRQHSTTMPGFPADSYWRLDAVLGWQPWPGLSVRAVAQNLTSHRHTEHVGFVLFQPEQAQVQRAFYGELSADF
jgi:iron complex outermembrane recepter protein